MSRNKMLIHKMANRFSILRISIIVALLAGVVLTGCRGPQDPDPSMTAVRSGTGDGDLLLGGTEDMSDGLEGLGLEGRDPSLMEGERVEGLFSPVYFDFDQSFVRPADRGVLQEVASYLSQNSAETLLVEGRCDWRGTTEYNMALGDRRAISVITYLQQLGVADSQMESVSKGDLDAITEGSEDQMQLDRRADLVIIR
jgi:peptidoglycan-associated lipoprotein